MGALLAATIAVTSPMAYAAPFDTDTGLAPLGMSHPAVHYTKAHVHLLGTCSGSQHLTLMSAQSRHWLCGNVLL